MGTSAIFYLVNLLAGDCKMKQMIAGGEIMLSKAVNLPGAWVFERIKT